MVSKNLNYEMSYVSCLSSTCTPEQMFNGQEVALRVAEEFFLSIFPLTQLRILSPFIEIAQHRRENECSLHVS